MQVHNWRPDGLLGKIKYRYVEEKEPWCENAKPISEIGVFTAEEFYATGVAGHIPGASEGVARLLMELGYQFDFIDSTLDFDKYRLLILPDVIPVDEELRDKLSTYLKKGGKLLVSYQSGLDRAHQKFRNLLLFIRERHLIVRTSSGQKNIYLKI